MDEPQDLEQGDNEIVDRPGRQAEETFGAGNADALRHLAKVEEEAAGFAAMDWPTLRTALRKVVAGTHTAKTEALIRVCRQANESGDTVKLNLAFEAVAKTATPLLLSQAFGQSKAEREDQAQEVLLELFEAVKSGKSSFAERYFSAFAKRRAVDLFRRRDAELEGKMKQLEPTKSTDGKEELDPFDAIPDDAPNIEQRVLLSLAVEKLPPNARKAFIQYYHLGMKQKEIAAQHDVNVRTVHQWLKDAHVALGLKGENDDR